MIQHLPVLTKEICSFLLLRASSIADLTLGLGGHSQLFLQQNPDILLYAVDRDEQALLYSKQKLESVKQKVSFFHNDFYTQVLLWKEQAKKFDFIFADLGVCSFQLDIAERGFSFSKNGKLDMRMDSRQELTAYQVVNFYSQEELQKIFFRYGEETRSDFFAKKIVEQRAKKLFETSGELGSFIGQFSFYKTKKIHPATKIFQAIRIEVNQELELLKKMLEVVLDILHPLGRLAVISFHSLEDRIVKNFFRLWAKPPSHTPYPLPKVFPKPLVKILTKKPITPSQKEIKDNPRSRSAKLRIIEKLELI